jgi:hypothetical protein
MQVARSSAWLHGVIGTRPKKKKKKLTRQVYHAFLSYFDVSVMSWLEAVPGFIESLALGVVDAMTRCACDASGQKQSLVANTESWVLGLVDAMTRCVCDACGQKQCLVANTESGTLG